MSAAIVSRADFGSAELRRLACGTRNANQARRLLALAAVYDGMRREDAARIGGTQRQTLRDWVRRFNAHGPDGLIGRRHLRALQKSRRRRYRDGPSRNLWRRPLP